VSLRRKYILILVAFALTLTVSGGWLAWTLTSGALERELEEKLVWVAGAAAEVGLDYEFVDHLRSPADSTDPGFEFTRERLRRLQRYVDEAYLFRRGGALLASTEATTELPIGTPLRWLDAYGPELDEAWLYGDAATPAFTGDDGRLYKYAFKRLDQSDVMLAVLMPADYLEPLEHLRRALILGAVASALLAVLLAGFLATNIVRPLERLSRVAIRIQRGRWNRPVEVERGDELGRLSRAMERMRKGIVQRDEQLRLMLAQVAHEIRNPLGGLELFATSALETDDREERLRLLDRVRNEVESLNEIINDFLTFARPLQAHPRLHDLREPLEEAVEIVRAGLDGQGDQLQVHLPDEPLTGRADPDHVKRVVLNLLQNAAQTGGAVRLSAWWRNGEAVISVQDDGPGVAPELRERIFEPFVTDKEQGAGLGLAIVQRILEINDGRIELADPAEPGEDPHPGRLGGSGAEFRVYFPGSDDLPPDAPGES
jgi:signal transduction histidine kinase